MMQRARGIAAHRVLNGAGIRIWAHSVMSGALITTADPIRTPMLAKDLDGFAGWYQPYSLKNDGLIGS